MWETREANERRTLKQMAFLLDGIIERTDGGWMGAGVDEKLIPSLIPQAKNIHPTPEHLILAILDHQFVDGMSDKL
jgi:hypothetical protein